MFNASTLTHEKPILLSPKNQTIDGIALNKPDHNPSSSASDAPDGPDRMPTENDEFIAGTEMNQFEISSDDDEQSQGAARSRPVRAVVAKKRKAKSVAKAKGRKQQNEETDDVFIE